MAMMTRQRSRLIETTAELRDGDTIICTATGKYIPLGPADTVAFCETFVEDAATTESAAILKPAGS
jgi:hypothetical protein